MLNGDGRQLYLWKGTCITWREHANSTQACKKGGIWTHDPEGVRWDRVTVSRNQLKFTDNICVAASCTRLFVFIYRPRCSDSNLLIFCLLKTHFKNVKQGTTQTHRHTQTRRSTSAWIFLYKAVLVNQSYGSKFFKSPFYSPTSLKKTCMHVKDLAVSTNGHFFPSPV